MDDTDAQRLWGRRIPNHRLTAGVPPPPDATADLLLRFGGTFDGYAVRPEDLPDWIPRVLESYERGEPVLLSLTMARAALFAFARWHHMTTWSGELVGSWARCMRALVERIRQLVAARAAGRRLPSGSLIELEDGMMDAYERLLEDYARWGGYRFHGWTNFPDGKNYQGPVIWSEADAVLRFAMELERVFPRGVHMEFAIGKATRHDYDPAVEKRQRVDLVVSDLSGFDEDDASQERLQTMQQGAFVETKWLVKGWAVTASSKTPVSASRRSTRTSPSSDGIRTSVGANSRPSSSSTTRTTSLVKEPRTRARPRQHPPYDASSWDPPRSRIGACCSGTGVPLRLSEPQKT